MRESQPREFRTCSSLHLDRRPAVVRGEGRLCCSWAAHPRCPQGVGQEELAEDLVDSIHLKTGTAGRPARTFVSESGLYLLILKSLRGEPKAFKSRALPPACQRSARNAPT